MKVLAIIGARGGSQGIPRKNLALLGGKPLIGWTVEAAVKSSLTDVVMVTTDDQEIAETAKRFGAEIPFMRPPELATDSASQVDVVNHALAWLEQSRNYRPDYIMLLQPTSPFRCSEDIDAAIRTAEKQNSDAVVSVSEIRDHPYYARTVDDLGIIRDLFVKRNTLPRRQMLPRVFTENGAIYLVKTTAFEREQSFMPEQSAAYIMPGERSIDIDTPRDLKWAEFILNSGSR